MSFLGYLQEGALQSGGMVPRGIGSTGQGVYEFADGHINWKKVAGNRSRSARLGGGMGAMAGGVISLFSDTTSMGEGMAGGAVLGMTGSMLTSGYLGSSMPGKRNWGKFGMPALMFGSTAYFTYQGYQENGLAGAKDALFTDLAVNAAVAKFGFKESNPEKALGTVKGVIGKSGWNVAARSIGAVGGSTVGGMIGSATGIPGAGTVGTFAGAYMGAAPMQFIASHPAMAVGAAAAGVVAAAGYGAYHVLKMGRAHAQHKKGIQTSGSMAAFMTGGAQTMRARGVMAMSKSHMNARSALGRESMSYANPARNYHSKYRL